MFESAIEIFALQRRVIVKGANIQGFTLPVVSEMVLSPEAFVADLAGEGSFVRVSPFVDEQVVALCEVALAVLADEFLLRPVGSSRSPASSVRKYKPENTIHFQSTKHTFV